MLAVPLLVSAVALGAPLQAPTLSDPRRIPERVWFARLTRDDLDWPRGKGVASEGSVRLPARLEAEIDRSLADLGADCVHVGGQLIESRTRVVGIGAWGGEAKDAAKKRLEAIGFRVEWLLATGFLATKEPEHPERTGASFTQLAGAFDGAPGPDGKYALVLHLPECKPERMLALMKDSGVTIPWDPVRLEIVSGDPGVGGMKLQQALRGLSGARLVPPGANAERFTVEVEMRQLSDLKPRGTGFGAPSAPIVDRLRKAGIEVREAR